MLWSKERSLFRLSAYVLIAFCIISVISASSIILLGKSRLDLSAAYTKNVISKNIQTGGLPYALITNDTITLRSIANAQLAYREVHAITIKDSSGRTLYTSKTVDVGDHRQSNETIPIIDTREPVAISDIDSSSTSSVLGYVEVTFTDDHANSMVWSMVLSSILITSLSLGIFIFILSGFNRSIRNYVSHVMDSLGRLKSGAIVKDEKMIPLKEFRKIHDDIVKTSLFLTEKDRSLRESYEAEKRAKNDSEKAAKFRDEMIKSVSHDLRTPVAVIDGLLKIVERSINDSNVDETTKRNVALCLSSSNVLKDIVEEIFNFDQFHSSTLRNNRKSVDVAQLMLPLADMYEGRCREKGIGFYCHIDSSKSSVYSLDAGKLTRIIENLLENAVKFTNRGTVNLSLNLEPHQVVVSVKDTGVGIPTERINDIFIECIQVERPEIKNNSGRGLGLSYVKSMCDALDATIEVSSVVGVGSRFVILIPADPADVAASVELVSESSYEGLSCLVIDDRLDVCILMETLLKQYGVDVKTECIPELGLQAIRSLCPDIVFVDYHMPEIDGLTLSRLVRDDAIANSITLIAVTADVHPDTQVKLAENFDFVLAKPVNTLKLREVLKAKWMARKTLDMVIGGQGDSKRL